MRIRSALAFGTAAAILAACGNTSTPDEQASANSSFIVGAGEVDSLNTVTTKTVTAQMVAANIYGNVIEEAFAESPEGYLRPTGEYLNALVEDYTVSDDGAELTFTLREGLTFADGSPLTSEDVVFTMQRTLSDASYVSGSSAVFMRISDPTAQITAEDETTVSVKLDGPAPAIDQFLALSTFGVVSAAAGAEEPGDDGWANAYFDQNATASGPFSVSGWSASESITLLKNPEYAFAEEVFADEVTILNMPDEDQRYLAVQNGDIDVALDLSPQLISAAEENEALTVHSIPSNTLYYVGLNPSVPPFDNLAVRQAIALAIPYETLIEEVMYSQASPAYGVVTSEIETSLAPGPDAFAYETDLEAARDILRDAGIENLSVDLSLSSGDTISSESAVYIQAALSEIGVNVNINQMADADFHTRSNNQELGFFIANWASWAQDPFFQMRALLLTDRATNRTGFANTEFDDAVLAGIVASDQAERQELSERAQQIVLEEIPMAGLFTVNYRVVTRNDVKGIALGSDTLPQLRYLSR